MLEKNITTGILRTAAAIEFADPFTLPTDRNIGSLVPINPKHYLDGVAYTDDPANNTFSPLSLEQLKFHPTGISRIREGLHALHDRYRSAGRTKVFRQTESGSYELNPPSVHEHVTQVVEGIHNDLTTYPELVAAGVNYHDAIIMGTVHDIGEGSTMGDLPASAEPATFEPFFTYLQERDLGHLLIVIDDHIQLNPDPAFSEEIAYAWDGLKRYFREAEARHATEILADNGYTLSRQVIQNIYDRFEDRHPNDLTAQLARIGDIRTEFDQYVNGYGWCVEPYGGDQAAAELVQGSIDISIARMLEPTIHLAHSMPWPAVNSIRQIVELELLKLYKTDFPERAMQALTFLDMIWNEVMQQSATREEHLAMVKAKAWLEIPPPSV